MPWILSIVFLAVEILAVASAVHALFTVRTAQGTIAWVIGLITFPWLGLPLYWFFGSRRFDAHSKVMKQALIKHQAKIHEVREEMGRFHVPRSEVRPSRVGDLAAVAGEQFLRGNRLDLLIRWRGHVRHDSGRIGQGEAVYFSPDPGLLRKWPGCSKAILPSRWKLDDYESRPLYFKAGAQAARLLAPIL